VRQRLKLLLRPIKTPRLAVGFFVCVVGYRFGYSFGYCFGYCFLSAAIAVCRHLPKIQFSGCSARRRPKQYISITRICNAAMRPKIGFTEVVPNEVC
jgi:hypothetical protein